jgi:hypothetical protein
MDAKMRGTIDYLKKHPDPRVRQFGKLLEVVIIE